MTTKNNTGTSKNNNAYQSAMRAVILHRDAGTENSVEGILARLHVMIVEPPDIAATLEQIRLEGHLPDRLDEDSNGKPVYAAEAVANYLQVTVDALHSALASVPSSRWPIQLTQVSITNAR